jgi:hypothetical protein
MTSPRIFVLSQTVKQKLPAKKTIEHPKLTRITWVSGPIPNESGRSVTTFKISDAYPLIELFGDQFSAPPIIVSITKDFNGHQIWDTFNVDFLKPHQEGFVYATCPYGRHEALELPIGICEPVKQHTAEIAACAV